MFPRARDSPFWDVFDGGGDKLLLLPCFYCYFVDYKEGIGVLGLLKLIIVSWWCFVPKNPCCDFLCGGGLPHQPRLRNSAKHPLPSDQAMLLTPVTT
jgi:hypothetical protein